MTPSSEPLVSVIISSYNHAPYIEECIESVLAQTYPHIELLVVDDGSTDDSVERIQSLQHRYGFDFQVQTNQGLTRTLNATIARARGSLIAPFGSDDVMLPDRIAIQVAHMQDKPEVGICAGNIELIDGDGNPLPEKKQRRDTAFRRMNFDDVFLQRKPYPPAPTLLFRREALEAVGGFDTDINLEDLMIELKITQAGWYIDALNHVFARYRKHPTNSYKNLRFMVDSVLHTYARFSDHPLYEQVRNRFLISMFLKSANRDKALAWELLGQLPLRAWNRKMVRGLIRLCLMPTRKPAAAN